MKTERLQEYFTVFCITAAGVLGGVHCAQLAGKGDFKSLGFIAAGIAVLLKTRIWMLIPLTWNLKSQSFLIPIPLSVHDVAIALSFGVFLIFTAFKLIRIRPKGNFGDFLMWVNMAWLAVAYIRNPVGVNALGTDRVGGRPYFLVLCALMGYWVLTRVVANVKTARLLPGLILSGVCFVTALSLVAYKIPDTVPVLSHIYSGVQQTSYNPDADQFAADASSGEDSLNDRVDTMLDFGLVTIGLLCAFYNPVNLLNPVVFWRFVLFIASWIAILASGHRLGIVVALWTIFICSYFRNGLLELMRMSIFFLPVLGILVMGHGKLFELPLVAQRSLSFLPGNWSHVAVQNAQDSNDWRFQMWDKVWHSNKYIHNKVLGDGFGTSQKAQDEIVDMMNEGRVEEAGMEGQLINGGFHSGPLTTIRTVGLVGLVPFYLWMMYLARYGYRLIRFSQGTPFFPVALYFGGGALFAPFFFTFVFGAFEGDLAQTVLGAGMLKLVYQSIEAYKNRLEEESLTEKLQLRNSLQDLVPADA